MNWKPIRKISAALVAFLASGAGVTLVNDLAMHIPAMWAGLIVGGVTWLTGYLVPSPKPAAGQLPPTPPGA